jgi:hypothetical protein
MDNKMTYLLLSPHYPPVESGQALKGRIASNISRNKFAAITPLRGQGVSKYNNKLLP